MVVIVYVSVQPAQLDTPLNCFVVRLRKGSVSVQFHACFHGKSAVFDMLIQLLVSSKLGTGRHMLIFAIKCRRECHWGGVLTFIKSSPRLLISFLNSG